MLDMTQVTDTLLRIAGTRRTVELAAYEWMLAEWYLRRVENDAEPSQGWSVCVGCHTVVHPDSCCCCEARRNHLTPVY